VNAQAVNRVKAYYAARAAVDLSLLRIKIYSQVQAQVKEQMGQNAGMANKFLDMIWSMPFSWPPMMPEEVNEVDKGLIQDQVKESQMDATFMVTISDEGSKIDINDLASPSKVLRELTKKRLLQIFENKSKSDEKWAREHSDLRPEDIINNISDWISPGRTSSGGGDKASKFSALGEGYPPNRAFRTVSEIRLIPGVTEDVFDLFANQITVYGMRAINPNHATKSVLMSLDPSITSEVADLVIKRRNSSSPGPFKDAKDFWSTVATSGGRIEPSVQQNLPIICDSVYNFKIKAIGNHKGATREISVITYDLQKSATQISDSLKSEYIPNQTGQSPEAPPAAGPQKSNNSPSKGPPRIVYWNEK
jgi:general secretion pathway protein K